MVSIVVAVHVLVCLSLVIVVLLQQGKGADIGAVFGGSSQTLFGSGGAGNFLTRLTSALAVVFFATSIFLAYASSRRASGSLFQGSGANSLMNKAAPAKPAAPAPAALPLPGSNPFQGLPGGGAPAPESAPAPKK